MSRHRAGCMSRPAACLVPIAFAGPCQCPGLTVADLKVPLAVSGLLASSSQLPATVCCPHPPRMTSPTECSSESAGTLSSVQRSSRSPRIVFRAECSPCSVESGNGAQLKQSSERNNECLLRKPGNTILLQQNLSRTRRKTTTAFFEILGYLLCLMRTVRRTSILLCENLETPIFLSSSQRMLKPLFCLNRLRGKHKDCLLRESDNTVLHRQDSEKSEDCLPESRAGRENGKQEEEWVRDRGHGRSVNNVLGPLLVSVILGEQPALPPPLPVFL
ncbi:hypothetical protein V1264_014134 [Littorina saxatilis]|uniref:Uncharacterized protein n=1 Tax=Littorina saxatilis TaxID=31220 RepID=A0AAN9BRU8_9CAEN